MITLFENLEKTRFFLLSIIRDNNVLRKKLMKKPNATYFFLLGAAGPSRTVGSVISSQGYSFLDPSSETRFRSFCNLASVMSSLYASLESSLNFIMN